MLHNIIPLTLKKKRQGSECLSEWVSEYMCEWVREWVHVCVRVHVYAWAWLLHLPVPGRPEANWLPAFITYVLSFETELSHWILAGQESSGCPCPCCSLALGHRPTLARWVTHGLGSGLRSPCQCSKHSIHWVISQAPSLIFESTNALWIVEGRILHRRGHRTGRTWLCMEQGVVFRVAATETFQKGAVLHIFSWQGQFVCYQILKIVCYLLIYAVIRTKGL